MNSIQHKKFLHVKTVTDQTWFVYEVYDINYQLVGCMAQPMGNTRFSVYGKTEEDLISNIEKSMLNKNNARQEVR